MSQKYVKRCKIEAIGFQWKKGEILFSRNQKGIQSMPRIHSIVLYGGSKNQMWKFHADYLDSHSVLCLNFRSRPFDIK